MCKACIEARCNRDLLQVVMKNSSDVVVVLLIVVPVLIIADFISGIVVSISSTTRPGDRATSIITFPLFGLIAASVMSMVFDSSFSDQLNQFRAGCVFYSMGSIAALLTWNKMSPLDDSPLSKRALSGRRARLAASFLCTSCAFGFSMLLT